MAIEQRERSVTLTAASTTSDALDLIHSSDRRKLPQSAASDGAQLGVLPHADRVRAANDANSPDLAALFVDGQAGIEKTGGILFKQALTARLDHSRLTDVLLDQCDLRGGVMYHSHLFGVVTTKCKGSSFSLIESVIEGSDLSGLGKIRSLRGCVVSYDSSLKGLDLCGADLRGIRFAMPDGKIYSPEELFQSLVAKRGREEGQQQILEFVTGLFHKAWFDDSTQMSKGLRELLKAVSAERERPVQRELETLADLTNMLNNCVEFPNSKLMQSPDGSLKITLDNEARGADIYIQQIAPTPELDPFGKQIEIKPSLMFSVKIVQRGLLEAHFEEKKLKLKTPYVADAEDTFIEVLRAVREVERQLFGVRGARAKMEMKSQVLTPEEKAALARERGANAGSSGKKPEPEPAKDTTSVNSRRLGGKHPVPKRLREQARPRDDSEDEFVVDA